jgi:type III secretion system YscD/HrpQ family protein
MTSAATVTSHHPDALELRVLHGPQAGSTLPLEHGEAYTLGTADTCAVLLAGTQIEEEHVTLTASIDGIHVEPLQGRVMTIDRGEVSSGQVMALGTVLRLGRVHLTVDNVDAPWPEDEPLEEPPPAAVPVMTAEAAEESSPVPAAPPKAKPASRATRRGSFMPWLVLAAASTMLMGAAVAAFLTSESERQPVTEAGAIQAAPSAAGSAAVATVDPVLDLAELSRAFPEGTLKASRGPNGSWVVNGRIASEQGRQRLRQVAASLPAAPEIRVMLDSERLAAVRQFVEKRRVAGQMELNVEQGNSGALRIVGAAATPASIAAVVDAARAELVDAAPVDFAVLPRSELTARFEDRLRAAGLASKVKIIRRDPQLEFHAVLTGAEVRVWEHLFKEFTREYGSVLTVRAQVQHERDTIEVQIETVVGGIFPYVVTTSGRRIAPGGVMEGRTLMAIRDGELVFSDGLRVRYGN